MERLFYLGVKGIIYNSDSKILLLKKKEGWWDFAGGRVKNNETVWEALKREVKEETNIDITEAAHLMTYPLTGVNISNPSTGGAVGLVLMIHVCKADRVDNIVLSYEHVEHRWVTPAQAADMISEKHPVDFKLKLKNFYIP